MNNSEEELCRWCQLSQVKRVAYCAKARWVINDPKDRSVGQLVKCPNCDLLYFEQSFSIDELQNMYSGYRGDDYFRRRNRYEPWYTKRVNDAIGHSAVVLQLRRQHLENLLLKLIRDERISTPERVLDVGGDEGQFIPDIPSIEERGVLEVSGVRPVEDVASFTSWEEAAIFRPDMLMMCHVLEHTDSAREMIAEAGRLLGPGNLLYLEVPLDRPRKISRVFGVDVYRIYTKWIAGHPLLFRVADLLSLISRRILGQPLIGSIIKQNEHINYFTPDSLVSVVKSFGFEEVCSSQYKPSSGVPIMDVDAVGVLFTRL